MSSSRTTPPENPRGTVRSVRSRITSLFGRYVVDAAVCVLAVIVIVEDLVSPTATLNDLRYDRGTVGLAVRASTISVERGSGRTHWLV